MATIVLSAVGASIGAGFGGSVLGLSGAVIGRAIGATIGQAIDQRLMGQGSRVVETGRIERFRLTGAGEGAPIAEVWGRVRVGGQVIWASRFLEEVNKKDVGGKGGGGGSTRVKEYSYSVSLAVALCAGEITRVGRIWADGMEIAPDDLDMRIYTGSEDQLPDPTMEAIEGEGNVPAYRGLAYVVFENLELGRFGNRVPQFSFEVMRPAQVEGIADVPDLTHGVRAVAMMPGTGEYALATTPVHLNEGLGVNRAVNVNSPSGKSDFRTALRALREELPRCQSVALVVSWFGNDLRCGRCTLKPKLEQNVSDGVSYPWQVSGLGRTTAELVAQSDGRPVYGGTPADGSVVEAIRALKDKGQKVVFYPFILMEQLEGNGLRDPWTGADSQPKLPWRGRITLSMAPGQEGSPDRSAAAEAEIAAFFGVAERTDFLPGTEGSVDAPGLWTVGYSGPAEWSYRRFILHYAWLCKLAGGVDAFCIGSEMRGLTQVFSAGDSFPAVAELRRLAADVRAILGPDTKIGYAADWSEYFGHAPGGGDLYYNLDPLWADENIDFVGIDNYIPIADWRDGADHADAGWGSIYRLDYLQSNIEGGELYDWYYASEAHRAAQIRSPITDGAHDEPWVWRAKDMRNWWQNAHHERIGGVRRDEPTAWVPRSKPIWFTEFGCPAVDKGANAPNKFLDPKSSESGLPHHSDGRRDDLMQMQYLRAVQSYWDDEARNPVSEVYGGRMIDMTRAHVWAWDARPYPQFPNRTGRWADGDNWTRGHWITGRSTAQPLARVIFEICARSGLTEIDVERVWGIVRGYAISDTAAARAALQPLLLAYGVEAAERDGKLIFSMRGGTPALTLDPATLAVDPDLGGAVEATRAPEAELAGRVRLTFVRAEGDFETRTVEAILPGDADEGVSASEVGLVLTRAEAITTAERWLSEARIARDGVKLSLPPSQAALGAGDVFALDAGEGRRLYRIDRVESAGARLVEATRVEAVSYRASDAAEERAVPASFIAPVPVFPLFLDLPLMRGDEIPHAPHLAVTATPWPGSVATFSSAEEEGYTLNLLLGSRAVIGVTQTPLLPAAAGLLDRGAPLSVQVYGGVLASVSGPAVLNGANLAAIGDGSSGRWELFQFANAELTGTDTYAISHRLRGQAGTEGIGGGEWPVGSFVVLLDGAAEQIGLAASMRGLARHYRIGPADRGYDDGSYLHRVEAFDGIGLRPYAPCHLRASRESDGALRLAWIRRTRVDGDTWAAVEVPLGEARERYALRVLAGGALLREAETDTPEWRYSAGQQAADGAVAPFEIEVAQISDAFGAGRFARIAIND